MLETFMFATESFGTWGPGPVPEPVGYWARILDSVANDPRAVVTIIAAFLGFLFAAWSKYLFDIRRDRFRRETDRRILAAVLRAELVDFEVECGSGPRNCPAQSHSSRVHQKWNSWQCFLTFDEMSQPQTARLRTRPGF